ncbi:MAG: thiamine phosphate synthase [Lonepinella koalarum]|nr:thiamine phosphate synthase [Lonepinella koalarum]
MNKIKQMLSVYFIAGTQDCRHLSGNVSENLLSILEQALVAGITCFQFRDKGKNSLEAEPEKQKQLAKQCLELCRKYHVPFIINDNVQLAIEIGADGIHVGQKDMAVSEVLAQTKHKLIVGLSTNNLDQVFEAEKNVEIDYIGVGPIFPTNSKADHSPALGIDYVANLKKQGITKPFVTIGGVNEESARKLKALGADGVAVISAIIKSENIAETVKQLKE